MVGALKGGSLSKSRGIRGNRIHETLSATGKAGTKRQNGIRKKSAGEGKKLAPPGVNVGSLKQKSEGGRNRDLQENGVLDAKPFIPNSALWGSEERIGKAVVPIAPGEMEVKKCGSGL